jgi:6-phosphogluconolactonase
MNTTDFETPDKAIIYVCQLIQQQLHNDITHKGKASLILTGGKTILPFLYHLSRIETNWSKVWITLSDERWVSIEEDHSNEYHLRLNFLNKLPIQPNFIGLKTLHGSPAAATNNLEESFQFMPQPFSCSLISMGEDGHIASLFLEERPEWEGNTDLFFASNFKGPRLSLGLKVFKECKLNIILCSRPRDINNICIPNPVLQENFRTIRF